MYQLRKKLDEKDALLLIDVQNDFLPGGALAVPKGDEVIPYLNIYISAFHNLGLPIFASRDWHPEDHCSFVQQGGPWPPHCRQNTYGAQFAKQLKLPVDTIIISTAYTSEKEAYSAFDGTDLLNQLSKKHIERIFVGGLATDYCVVSSVVDALKAGLKVELLVDAIRAINVKPDDGQKAIEKMLSLGAQRCELCNVQSCTVVI